MFLRVKKVKGKEYCYLVENQWKKKSCQKVRKYLGATVHFESDAQNFFEFYDVNDLGDFFNRKTEDLLRDVVLWELAKAGFVDKGRKLEKNNVLADKDKMKLTREGREVVLALNEGYLCSFTLKRILCFHRSGDIDSDSVELARRFVDAGLNVPKEVFIEFFKALR